jgi:hypothetical protein
MKEFGFDVGSEPGSLAKIVDALGKEHVNIEGIAGITAGDKGSIRLVADNPGEARNILRKLQVEIEESEAIDIDLPNHPGELATLLQRLASEGINVLSCYAAVERNKVILTVDHIDRTKQILHLA